MDLRGSVVKLSFMSMIIVGGESSLGFEGYGMFSLLLLGGYVF